MRALITRPSADADTLAKALESRGIEAMVEPLLEIALLPNATVDFTGVQGVLITSANGVRILASATTRRDLPVWAVGGASAAEARRLGFSEVASADGNVAALTALVAARVDPKRGALLHPAGRHVAGDLAAGLGKRGFETRRITLYEAHPAQAFSANLRTALAAHSIDLAVFFSPRTAATFVRLARSAGLDGVCATIRAYVLSDAVAEAFETLGWRMVRVAGQPTQEALLAAIDADAASGRAAG